MKRIKVLGILILSVSILMILNIKVYAYADWYITEYEEEEYHLKYSYEFVESNPTILTSTPSGGSTPTTIGTSTEKPSNSSVEPDSNSVASLFNHSDISYIEVSDGKFGAIRSMQGKVGNSVKDELSGDTITVNAYNKNDRIVGSTKIDFNSEYVTITPTTVQSGRCNYTIQVNGAKNKLSITGDATEYESIDISNIYGSTGSIAMTFDIEGALRPFGGANWKRSEMYVGDKRKISVTLEGTGEFANQDLSQYYKQIVYGDYDHSIISIDENGNITALKEGTTRVSAKLYYNATLTNNLGNKCIQQAEAHDEYAISIEINVKKKTVRDKAKEKMKSIITKVVSKIKNLFKK